MGFCGFFLVHVGQVILAGWNNFRSMVSGYEIQPAPQAPPVPEPPVLEALAGLPVAVDPIAVEESLANEPMAEEIQEGEHE
jgi:hypothetical protein